MLPHGLFGNGPFLLVIPLAVAAGMIVSLRGAARSGIPWKSILRLQIALTIVALFGARGFSLVFDQLWNPLDPDRTPIVGGWRASGGIFALAVALPLLRARLLPEVSLARYADLLGPTVAISLGVYRVQCLLAGCCGGSVCDGFFCFSYAPFTEIWQTQLAAGHIDGSGWSAPALPLHLGFMAASLGVGAFLWRRDPHRRFDGEVFLLFLVLHEGAKFALELLREPPSLLLQVSSLLPAALGLAAWLAISSRLRGRAEAS
jgi:phosphatidylglycerol---prolipoprotein diacylglyceryl transferase